ncbi:MAG: TRAP transporter small permease [Granulosicoccus sp.]
MPNQKHKDADTRKMHAIGIRAGLISMKLNKVIEAFCVFLLIVLVLDVWLGILARYVIPLPLTFTEELARYLMIWMALLAVSCGVVYREHIGVEYVFSRAPVRWQRWLRVSFDVIAFAFFLALLWYGIDFVERGFRRVTMIYGMPKGYPFIGVPLAAAAACIQLILVSVRDFCTPSSPDQSKPVVSTSSPLVR